MADDLVDWADVAAVGRLGQALLGDNERPIREACWWYLHHRHEIDVTTLEIIAEGLREAFAAGLFEGRHGGK